MVTDVREHVTHQAIALAAELAKSYELVTLQPLLRSLIELSQTDELSVAVVGRFKAGKSSFLNHFLGRDLLPVGVTPVTAVVTEIAYGKRERAVAHFLDGRTEEVRIEEIPLYVAESENPENEKRVSTLNVELPQLERMRSLRFVDMPGLESALAHNTKATLDWLPKVGLALVAVSVDPPLSQHDVALLRRIYEYTPHVSILLTKVDLLTDAERTDVINYVRHRLTQVFGPAPEIFPYSVRVGYEHYQKAIEENLFRRTLDELHEQRAELFQRKLETLLRECRDYLTLALSAAEKIESERATLQSFVNEQRQALEEMKSELQLISQHAIGRARAQVEKRLEPHRQEIEARLVHELHLAFSSWTKSLAFALDSFQSWLTELLTRELAAVCVSEREHLIAPLINLKRQVFRTLQSFREQLSERCERAFGVALRTTESEIKVAEPHTPDIRIGRVFDRNWELLSAVVPMALAGSLVRRHFAAKVPYMVEKNFSRLTTQWDESLRSAMMRLPKEAELRLGEIVTTVERLISTSNANAPRVRADVARVDALLGEIRSASSQRHG